MLGLAGQDKKSAFSLVELLIVVLILGSLSVIIVPRVGQNQKQAKIAACNTNIRTINSQMEICFVKTGVWPQEYSTFAKDTDYFPDGPPECPSGVAYVICEKTHRLDSHSCTGQEAETVVDDEEETTESDKEDDKAEKEAEKEEDKAEKEAEKDEKEDEKDKDK